jgi:putative transposase
MNMHVPMFRIGPNDRLTIDGIEFRMRQRLAQGYVLARVDDPGVIEDFTHQRLHMLSQSPRFRFDRDAFNVGAIAARMESDVDLIAEIPVEERKIVIGRRFYCVAFLKLESEKKASRSDASMKQAIKQIDVAYVAFLHTAEAKRNDEGDIIPPRPFERKAPLSISPRTLRSWLNKYENAGLRAVALRDGFRRCGDRVTPRLEPEIKRLLAETALLYAAENRPSVSDLHRKLVADLEETNRNRVESGMPALRPPSYERLLAEVRSMPEFDVYAGRYGLPAAMKKFAMVANGPDVTRPLQRTEMDELKLDLMTAAKDTGAFELLSPEDQQELRKKRYWLCAIMDVRTRVVLGMKIAAGVSASLALDTLEMAVSPKRQYAADAGAGSSWDYCGSPESVVHDQGAAFMSGVFRRAVVDLGCDPDAPPAGLAWLRGSIERLFRTISEQALAPFTGRTFGSVEAKGDYDPIQRATLTIEELCQALVRWVVDIYHNTPHAGLGGETPANAWARLVAEYGIIPPPDRHVRRAIFGVDQRRVITSRGIRVAGLFYNTRELQAHRRAKGDVEVAVKVDALDLGHVSVNLGNGWLVLPCMRKGFDDVPMSIWLAAAADLRRRFVAEARLTDAIVSAAVRDAWAMAEIAQKRREIFSTRPSSEELAHVEYQIGLGFPSPDDNETEALPPGDLMAKAIPTRAQANAPAPTPVSKPSRTIKPRN